MTQLRRTSSAARSLPRLDALPDEVVEAIFSFLDAGSLIAVSQVLKKFVPLGSERLLWRDLCLRDFTFWDSRHEIKLRKSDPSFREWKALYTVRHMANVGTRKAVRAMIGEPVARLALAQKVLEHGYGTKDELLRLAREASSTDYPLAQRYFTQMVLGCLNRAIALETWTKVRYRSDVQHPTELALACMDMFVLGDSEVGDIEDTFRRLDEYVEAVRKAYPDLDEQTPRTKAMAIAEFLRSKEWLGIREDDEYYAVDNQFLGIALRSERRNSLPLLTCVIYCYVCRAFNLRAQPCNYPMHIHAVIQPPITDPPLDIDNKPLPTDHPSLITSTSTEPEPSSLTHLYMDPFNTHTPVTLSSLRSKLHFVAPNASSRTHTSYLTPASPRELLIRTSNNIIRSVTTTHEFLPSPQTVNIYSAVYAALFALVMFPTTAEGLASSLVDLRQHFAHHFSHDLWNYQQYILPLTVGLGAFGGDRGIQDPLVNMIRQEDSTPKVPKHRPDPASLGPGEQVPIYKIGQVFKHRRQHYTAVIYGWDTACKMKERWIVGNGVDRLPQGRSQPFYNSFVSDGSTRYVAQENVVLLGPEEFTADDVDGTFETEIGKWFLRFDGATATFVSNVRDEYPED